MPGRTRPQNRAFVFPWFRVTARFFCRAMLPVREDSVECLDLGNASLAIAHPSFDLGSSTRLVLGSPGLGNSHPPFGPGARSEPPGRPSKSSLSCQNFSRIFRYDIDNGKKGALFCVGLWERKAPIGAAWQSRNCLAPIWESKSGNVALGVGVNPPLTRVAIATSCKS